MKIRSLFCVLILITAFAAAAEAQSTRSYSDAKHGFSVSYPGNFKVRTGKSAATETAFGEPGRGVKLAKFSPRSIPAKHHGEYEFNVWRSNAKAAKCGVPIADESNAIPIEAPATAKTRTIAGHKFYAYTGSEGGMSKSLGVNGYRGMAGGKCWQIQSMTYQVSAFDDFKPFNQKPIDRAFDKFVRSFKFKN